MIEVREYARNECGIYKIIGKYERRDPYDLCVQLGNFYTGEFEGEQYESRLKIGKLIDLIEEGDFVNGYPVRRIQNFNNELCNFDLNTMEWIPLRNIDVYYNVLTKEQYMQNCYTVERKEEC